MSLSLDGPASAKERSQSIQCGRARATGKVVIPLALVLTLCALPLTAQETPTVGEVFLCTFHEGKSWPDLEAATAVYNSAVAESGIEPANEFVWRPFRSQADFDFLWAAYYPDLKAWGRGVTGYMGSEAGAVADTLWAAVADCDSAMTLVENIYDSDGLQSASRDPRNPNALESYVCTLNEGKTMADLDAAIARWHAYVTKLGLPMDVYKRTPFIGTSPTTDVSIFAVHPSVNTFAQTATTYQSAEGFDQVQAGFNEANTCRSSLWLSWQVSPPAP